MLKYLINGLVVGGALKLLGGYGHRAAQLLRIEAAKCYLHGVRMARLSAIGLLLLGLTIGFMLVGVLLIHAGLFILLPWSLEAKAVLGIILGVLYVALGGLTLRAAMDEKTWMLKSGAAEMLAKATAQSEEE